MAKLQPKDKVEWRAGDTPSTTHLRQGVVKEVHPDGICLVRTRVEGAYRFEEIRSARLKLVEEPKKSGKKKGPSKKRKGKKRAPSKKKKAAKKKAKEESA